MRASDKSPYPQVQGRSISNRYTLYVLKLEKGRYYVGRTEPQNLQTRIQQHRNLDKKQGSAWTRAYKVVQELTSLYQYNKSPFDQDRKVKELMYLYGVNMVRGGSYSQTMDLSPQEANHILRQIYGATDKCLKCGASGHWVKDCPQVKKTQPLAQKQNNKKSQGNQPPNNDKKQQIKTKINEKKQEYWYLPRCFKCNGYGHYANTCDYDNFTQEFRNQYQRSVKCWNCGKYGHYADDCWEIDSFQSQQSQVVCYNCNTPGHKSTTCWKKKSNYQPQVVCYKCNTPGHKSTTCWKKPNSYRQDSYTGGYKKTYNKYNKNYDDDDDRCFKCGKRGHWADDCWSRY